MQYSDKQNVYRSNSNVSISRCMSQFGGAFGNFRSVNCRLQLFHIKRIGYIMGYA